MKKRNLVIAAAAIMALSLAACGSKSTSESAATASDVASASEVEDPEIKKLEEMTVPDMPKLKDMGMIKMGKLEDLTVEVSPKITADDEMVNKQIDYILKGNKEETDAAAKTGDVVNINYVGKIDGKEFDGGTGNNYDLELGSGSFIPGFEDQLVGLKKGEKKTIQVTFPEDYQKEDLKGKAATFDVTINKVQAVPELTDEWIKKNAEKIGSKATDVASFREEQKNLLQARFDAQYQGEIQQAAIEKIISSAEIGISDEMKNYAEAYVISSEIKQMKQYGYSVADMLKLSGTDVKQFKEDAASVAANYAKQRFVVAYLADEQNITATDENIDALIKTLSATYGQEVNKVQLIEQYGGDVVKEDAVNQAVLRYIASKVKVVEKTAEEKAAEESKAAESTEAETETVEETTVPETVEAPAGGAKANATVKKVK